MTKSLRSQSPGKLAQQWRNRIPVYIDGADRQMNAGWADLRTALIDTGRESRLNIITIDKINLWDVRREDDDRLFKATVATAKNTPEVRVLIEQAKQYQTFKTHAEDGRKRVALHESIMADEGLDPEARLKAAEVVERLHRDILQAEKEASKMLVDLRETAIRCKTLAVSTVKHADASLSTLATLAQNLVLAKERMELDREKAEKNFGNLTDAELEEQAKLLSPRDS